MRNVFTKFLLASIVLSNILAPHQFFAIPQSSSPAFFAPPERYARNELIIRFKSPLKASVNKGSLLTGISQLDSLNAVYRLKEIVPLFRNERSTGNILVGCYLFRFSQTPSLPRLKKDYEKLPTIDWVEYNHFYYVEPQVDRHRIKPVEFQTAQFVENIRQKYPVVVAMIDAGINFENPYLRDKFWRNKLEKPDGKDNDANGLVDDIWGWNFVRKEAMNDNWATSTHLPMDESGHGTLLAQIITAPFTGDWPNQAATKGLQIMALKAGSLTREDKISITAAAAAQAIVYAADNNAQLICIAWAGEDSSRLLHQAIRYAVNRKAVVIAAAGDYNSQLHHFPAAFNEVWAVTATSANGQKYWSSNFGPWIDLSAPAQFGENMGLPDSIRCWPSATAIAAANVSRLALLLLSNERLTGDSLKKRILWSSDNIYLKNPQFRGQLGAGQINFSRALNAQFLPNIIVQQVRFERLPSAIAEFQPLRVNTWIQVKNLSSSAHDVTIRVSSNRPNCEILNPTMTIPLLGYNEQFNNEAAPMMLLIPPEHSSEGRLKLTLSIATAEGFQWEQECVFLNRIIEPPILMVAENYPAKLHWNGDTEFVGYHIYRKEAQQRSFRKLNPAPISDTTFTDFNIVPALGYSYYVTAVDSTGQEMLPSNVVSIQPEPTSLFRFHPRRDTSICDGASIIFEALPLDRAQHSYQWWMNGRPLVCDSNRLAFSSYIFEHPPCDTVSVQIHHAGWDTLLTHSWLLTLNKRQANLAVVAAMPCADTTISLGDSIKFLLKLSTNNCDSFQFRWQINQQIVPNTPGPELLLSSHSLTPNKNIITVEVSAPDTSFAHQWVVYVKFPKLKLDQLLFRPASDTAIANNDTLKLSVLVDGSIAQAFQWRWFINGRQDSAAKGPNYWFVQPEQSLLPDTFSVKIADEDSSVSHRWIVHWLRRFNHAPQLRFCSPPLDSFVMKSDSIQFQVLCRDPDNDSLLYIWSLNGVIDSAAHQPQYRYRIRSNSSGIDTLVVRVADADTAISVQWIVWPNKLDLAPTSKLIHWWPQDSLVINNDSLIFRVGNAGEDYRFQWQVNHRIDSLARDSLFVYHSHSSVFAIDTIAVLLLAGDSTIMVHRWYVQNRQPSSPRSLRLAFYPETETVSGVPGDSVIFAVAVLEGTRAELQFRWSAAQQLIAAEQDSNFCYHFQRFRSPLDTVWVTIVWRDTVMNHHWIIIPKQPTTLPAPRLIFPIHGNRIHEEDQFVWENDSLLSTIVDPAKCRYAVQLCSDSSFSRPICSDTCRTQSIKLNSLSGFDRLGIGQPFYWRVKLLTDDGMSSGFRQSTLACSYYPQFAQLNQFYGRYNSDATIDIFWIVSYPVNCAGFHLYRSESSNSNFIRMNDQLITGSENYSFQDRTAEAGKTYFYKLEQLSVTGKKKTLGVITLTAPKPEKFMLWQNYPNPFNTQTSIKYEIPTDCQVKIVISNVLGRKIKTLVDEYHKAGFYNIYWNGKDDAGEDVVSGIYFYSLITPTERQTRKMVIAR